MNVAGATLGGFCKYRLFGISTFALKGVPEVRCTLIKKRTLARLRILWGWHGYIACMNKATASKSMRHSFVGTSNLQGRIPRFSQQIKRLVLWVLTKLRLNVGAYKLEAGSGGARYRQVKSDVNYLSLLTKGVARLASA